MYLKITVDLAILSDVVFGGSNWNSVLDYLIYMIPKTLRVL